MSEKLSKRLSTLRLRDEDYTALERLLSDRKKSLGMRGEKITIQDLIREAIQFYIRYSQGDFVGDPSDLEKQLSSIVEMREELKEVVSFVKFIQQQSGVGASKRKGL